MKIKSVLFSGDADANLGLVLLRVFVGAAMMTHGIPKMFGGLDPFTGMVAKLNIPAPAIMALIAALAESLGALLLVLGLATRPAAALLSITMAVAAFVALSGSPFDERELPLFYLCATLLFLFKGAGKWSFDAALRHA